MKRIACLCFVLFFMSLGQVFADYYDFTYIDGTFNLSGTLITAPGAGSFPVVGGSLGDASVYTGLGIVPTGAYYTSPAGAFWYDNLLSPGSTPALTYWGLLFTEGTFGTDAYKEINIWGNSGPNDYSYEEWTAGNYVNAYNDGTFTVTDITSVPEPPVVLFLGLALLGLIVVKRSLRSKSTVSV